MNNWWESDWFKNWEQLAKMSYHGLNPNPPLYYNSLLIDKIP